MSNDAQASSPANDPDLAPDSAELVLALDSGQSGTRGRIVRGTEVVADDLQLPAMVTDHSVIEQLATFIETVHRDHEVDAVALGVSGLTDADTADLLLDRVRPLGIRRIALAHDSVSSYLGALGADPGVVVAAGTGVVTMAVGADTTARVDGWGWIMGDNGSGWWIGSRGLDAGMRAFDGRTLFGRASEAMLDIIRDDFGDPATAYMQLQADPARVQKVAGYARVVLDLAESGDAACLQIADAAALELATSAVSGLRLVRETNAPRVATLGGIFRSRPVLRAFERHLHELLPGAVRVDARGSGLDGAVVLAGLASDHPLREKFTEAQA